MNGATCLRIDDVVTCCSSGSILAGIFMVERRISLGSQLSIYIKIWKRYVDDTITYATIEAIDHILSLLYSFDSSIQLTYEVEITIQSYHT